MSLGYAPKTHLRLFKKKSAAARSSLRRAVKAAKSKACGTSLKALTRGIDLSAQAAAEGRSIRGGGKQKGRTMRSRAVKVFNQNCKATAKRRGK